jgi:glycosyltransferase involved in cell wall biosynthesis
VTDSVLYAAFDAYPGLKGAQAHIRVSLAALARLSAQVTLLCLGHQKGFRDPETSARVLPFHTIEPNFLRRSEQFGRFVTSVADSMLADPPHVLHFRDIWSGAPLLSHPLSRRCRTVFEVNGLPSVELPSHFPGISDNRQLLARLRRHEEECLTLADRVITISRHTADYLRTRGCPGEKISVIPNAADPPDLPAVGPTRIPKFDLAVGSGRKIILYAGTLAPWQGLDTVLTAFSHLRHRNDHYLVIAASSRKGMERVCRQIACCGVGERVSVVAGVPHRSMAGLHARAWLSVAPLTRGARNELQGCSPIKIVESMAAGTPVLASDLPVVRELISHGRDGWLFPAGSARALAASMERLLDDEPLRNRLSRSARERARREFGTALFAERLGEVYGLATGRASMKNDAATSLAALAGASTAVSMEQNEWNSGGMQ